jgi:hypothetical protein
MIERHPFTARMYGIGIPAWLGLAAGGLPLALFVGLVVTLVIIVVTA